MQVGISAGYSLDNTIREAREDLERLYGAKAEMVREFAYIERQLGHSISLEELLYDLGIRSRVEDILNFTDVLIQAKKMGGNMRGILNRCIFEYIIWKSSGDLCYDNLSFFIYCSVSMGSEVDTD